MPTEQVAARVHEDHYGPCGGVDRDRPAARPVDASAHLVGAGSQGKRRLLPVAAAAYVFAVNENSVGAQPV